MLADVVTVRREAFLFHQRSHVLRRVVLAGHAEQVTTGRDAVVVVVAVRDQHGVQLRHVGGDDRELDHYRHVEFAQQGIHHQCRAVTVDQEPGHAQPPQLRSRSPASKAAAPIFGWVLGSSGSPSCMAGPYRDSAAYQIGHLFGGFAVACHLRCSDTERPGSDSEARVISARSSAVSATSAAPMFSWSRCSLGFPGSARSMVSARAATPRRSAPGWRFCAAMLGEEIDDGLVLLQRSGANRGIVARMSFPDRSCSWP